MADSTPQKSPQTNLDSYSKELIDLTSRWLESGAAPHRVGVRLVAAACSTLNSNGLREAKISPPDIASLIPIIARLGTMEFDPAEVNQILADSLQTAMRYNQTLGELNDVRTAAYVILLAQCLYFGATDSQPIRDFTHYMFEVVKTGIEKYEGTNLRGHRSTEYLRRVGERLGGHTPKQGPDAPNGGPVSDPLGS